MKYSLFFGFILLQFVLLFSCSQKKELLTEVAEEPRGSYSGTYRIQAGDYIQYGLVNLTFRDSTYQHSGYAECPSSTHKTKFQYEGYYFISGDTINFNPGCDEWSRVVPIEFLCGPFVYHLEEGMTIYEQRRDSSFVYQISLNEKE